MKQLDEVAQKEFKYGNQEVENDNAVSEPE